MDARNVLWTGGWDSTFRVLMLSLAEGQRVAPHYLVDPGRRSTLHEVRAIESIREHANARGADIDLPNVRPVEAIPISARAETCHQQLVDRFGIGPQYLWLSEYARTKGLDRLELCIHVDDKAYAAIETPADEDVRQAADFVFRLFEFPLLHVSKREMAEQARASGFYDLMECTWFCHLPTRSGQPCGFCSPCRWTAGEGLSHRLTRIARARGLLEERLVSRLPSHRLRYAIRDTLRSFG